VTNSSLRSALERGLVLAALVLAGCGEKDGSKELADGWAAYEAHDLKKADRPFSKSLGYNAANADALVASARVKLALGEIAAAKAALSKASALAGTDDDVVLLGAQVAYHAKDYRTAASAFRDMAADAGRDAKLRAQAYAGLAVVETTCNEPERARIALLKAMLLDWRCAVARYHLGLLYRNLGYEAAALEQFETYVLLEKDDVAHVQRVQRKTIPALKDAIARKAMDRPGADRRDSAAAAQNLQNAEAEWKKGNFKKAKAWYADALKADPLSYPAAFGLAQAWEKTDATTSGRSNALACYQTACALKPGAIKALLTVNRLATALGNVAVAGEACSRAVAFDPKNAEAIDGLIRALRKQGGANAKTAALWQSYRDQLKRR